MTPKTVAEASAFQRTSTHAEVMHFIAQLDALGDRRLFVSQFGVSPQGRELPLLVLSSSGVRNPAQARARKLPVVLVLGGIHAGEVEGKEAVLALARDMLRGDSGGSALLEHLTLLIAPLFNPDGNDAMSRENRKLNLSRLTGQRGPDVVGTRVNGSNINLNRDYLRQAGTEMRLLQANVFHQWQPDLTIDTHSTNGSVHRFAMTYDVPHTSDAGRPEPIAFMRDIVAPKVAAAVKANWKLDSGWYGNFVEDERALDAAAEATPEAPVREGWVTYPHHPRFGSNYRGLIGRLDLLLECYSYLTYEERVRTSYAWIIETLKVAAACADQILALIDASKSPRDRIAIRSKIDLLTEPIEVLTYSPRSFEGAPTSVVLPHYGRASGTVFVDRPRAYLVPESLGAALRRHGLKMDRARGAMDVQVATVEAFEIEKGRAILEASTVGDLKVSWKRSQREAPDGWLFVPTAQPLGAIAVYLCEPESDDGAIENGFVEVPKLGAEFPAWRVD